jgi:predicted nucleic acid-binding protein
MIIVSDSTPLICFAILDMLDILNVIYEEMIVPSAVYDEISFPNKPYSEKIKKFLKGKVVVVKNKVAVSLLEKDIDPGEAESIVLAIEKHIEDVLIDDFKGRRAAKTYDLKPIGTIGVLLQAKKLNHIKRLKPLLDKLIRNKIRIGIPLYKRALELAEEL